MNEKILLLEQQLNLIDSDANSDIMAKIEVLNELAWELRHIDLTRAYELVQQARELLESHPHPREQAKCQATLAEIFVQKGNYQHGLLLGNAALTLAEQVGLEYLQPYLLSTLGGAHWLLGNLAEAMALFQQQYRTAQQLNDKNNEAEALNNIALIHFDSGDLISANKTLQQALALYETLQDDAGQATVLNNLAMNFQTAANYAAALTSALRALELIRVVGNQPLELAVLDTIGQIYLKQQAYPQALTHFQQTLELANAVGVTASKGTSLLAIGRLYALQQDENEALIYLHQARQHLEQIDQKKDLFECHRLLAEIYEGQADPVRALHHYKQYHTIKEQVFNEQADQKLKKLQIAHDVETLKKEAELQRLKNVELQAALDRVKQLSGLLPICANCKKIRDDTGYWQDVAVYIRDHSEAEFSHGICPDCMESLYSGFLRKFEQ
jgi:tetratricopeptide (TPR) repeat protein